MKIGLITPIPHLNDDVLKRSSFHMVLGHLLENNKYYDFYQHLKERDPNAYILCDNSANEGYMLKGNELLTLADNIDANEIIAPDKYHDYNVTIHETFSFLDDFYEKDIKDRFKVMAVPQGKTLGEYLECYDEFTKDPRIDVIGIGYRNLIPALMDDISTFFREDWKRIGINEINILINSLEDNCFSYTLSRILFMKSYAKFQRLKRTNKLIHLLGLYNPIELKIINNIFTKSQLANIRSCDSAAPWQAAQVNLRFNKQYGVMVKPKAFLDFEQECNPEQQYIFEYNWKLLKEWAKHEK